MRKAIAQGRRRVRSARVPRNPACVWRDRRAEDAAYPAGFRRECAPKRRTAWSARRGTEQWRWRRARGIRSLPHGCADARAAGRNGRARARRSHRRTASAPDRSGRGKAHGSIPVCEIKISCTLRFSSRERRTRPAHRPERSCPDPSPIAPAWCRSAVPRRGEKSSPRRARRFQREPCCPR